MSDDPKVIPLRRPRTDAERRADLNSDVRTREHMETAAREIERRLALGCAEGDARFILIVFRDGDVPLRENAPQVLATNAAPELANAHLEYALDRRRG